MWEKDLARRTLDEHNEQMMRALKEGWQRRHFWPKWGSSCKAAKRAKKFSPPPSAMPQRSSPHVVEPYLCSIRHTISSKLRGIGASVSSRLLRLNWSPAGRCEPGIRTWFLLAITPRAVTTPPEWIVPICVPDFGTRRGSRNSSHSGDRSGSQSG